VWVNGVLRAVWRRRSATWKRGDPTASRAMRWQSARATDKARWRLLADEEVAENGTAEMKLVDLNVLLYAVNRMRATYGRPRLVGGGTQRRRTGGCRGSSYWDFCVW
jgi:hypothetical protein